MTGITTRAQRRLFAALTRSVLAFFVTCSASAATSVTVFTSFVNGSPSTQGPVRGALAQARTGCLYGEGGANSYFTGTVFRICPQGGTAVIHQFGAADHNISPQNGLTLGKDGNLYGVSQSGGTFGVGAIFKISVSGTTTILHDFDCATGCQPGNNKLALGNDGNLYGTTDAGGNGGTGVAFRITPAGAYTVLHHFTHATGDGPWSLTLGWDGKFYGVTRSGGTQGKGTFFRLTPTGAYTVVRNLTHPVFMTSPAVLASDGNYYGTSLIGGPGNNSGEVFGITPRGVLTVLHTFDGLTKADEGIGPWHLTQSTDGTLLGTTVGGGIDNNGVLYRLALDGTFDVLHRFVGAPVEGSIPTGITQSTNGKFYIATNGGGYSTDPNIIPQLAGTIMVADLGLAPFVKTMPTTAKAGTTVALLSSGLTPTGVKFNDVTAAYKPSSWTYMTAVVPAGPATGFVTVATSTGTLMSNEVFRVTPVLSSFAPGLGPVGSSVVVTGKSLSQTTAVTIGGKAVTAFTVDDDSQLTLSVPVGAKTGKIVVTTAGGKATSKTAYTVTP